MGVLAPGSAHARPSARPPIDTSGNFPAHMSAESPSNISPILSKFISDVSDPYDTFFSFLFLPPLFKTTERVVVGFQIFAWALKKSQYNINHHFCLLASFILIHSLLKTSGVKGSFLENYHMKL